MSLDEEKREYLGREVRNVWVDFAREQADPKPAHLLPWAELDEANKEVDRRIGEHIAEVVTHDYARLVEDAKHAVSYPAVWPKPVYYFGQAVLARYGGGTSLVSIIGMRFRTASKWEYQIVELIDGTPDVYCDGRWYPEFALSEEQK